MKLIILSLPFWLCGSMGTAAGQQNIQFIYLGSDPRAHENVLITSEGYRGDYLKGKDSRLTKIYYTDQRVLDTLRSYISCSGWVKRGDTSERETNQIDTVKKIIAYEIIGVDSCSLYIKGKGCFELFSSTWKYLARMGLAMTAGSTAMDDLKFECDEETFRHRETYCPQPDTNNDPFRRLKDFHL